MEEVKRTVRIVWLNSEGKKTPLVTEQHRPNGNGYQHYGANQCLGHTDHQTNYCVQLMVVTSSHS